MIFFLFHPRASNLVHSCNNNNADYEREINIKDSKFMLKLSMKKTLIHVISIIAGLEFRKLQKRDQHLENIPTLSFDANQRIEKMLK